MTSQLSFTDFVGIRNSKVKLWLLETQIPEKTILVQSSNAAYDCIRHLDFLEHWRVDPKNYRESVYWNYLVHSKGSEQAADKRCKHFGNLYDSICAHGWDRSNNPIAITDDGIRLDGSHRAAIAKVLGIAYLEAAVYDWNRVSMWDRWDAKNSQYEARVKRAVYHIAEKDGPHVVSTKGLYLGKFIQVETRFDNIGIFQKRIFIAMIEKPNKGFIWYPVKNIKFVAHSSN